jgi:hypothetical protein
MKARRLAAGLVLALVGLGSPTLVAASQANAAPHHVGVVDAKYSCTKTSSGSCIRGGQFCPQASYGHVGYDAQGRKYICKGSHSHPHWMLP